MKEKIYDLNDVKIVKRWSPIGFFFALFALGLASLVVISLFVEINSLIGVASGDEISLLAEIKGLDLIFAIVLEENPIVTAVGNIQQLADYKLVFSIFYLVVSCFMYLSAFFSLIVALKALWLIFFGQLRNPSSFLSNIRIAGFSNLLYFGSIFATFFLTQVIYDLTNVKIGMGVSIFTLIGLGCSLGIPLICSIYYFFGYRNRYYRAYMKIFDLKSNTPEVVYQSYDHIPETLKHIGGHSFANNQNIRVAKVPKGVKEIGPGAFANCGILETVILPRSVKKIGYNAFFNCPNLKEFIYTGNKDSFKRIKRGSNWLEKAGTDLIQCSDKKIKVDPTK